MDLRARLGNGVRIARNNRGFTLIEMAIVLIIIGIILGAVVKGKDLIRSGEQKKVYNKFINAWRTSYLSFYDRTGKILGDTNKTGGDGHANKPNCTQLIDGDANFYGLKEIGLTPPTTNAGNACTYRYSDSEGGQHDVTITFDYNTNDKTNILVINNIPNELGMAIDSIVDGEADGKNGDFLAYAAGSTTYTPTVDWGTTPTDEVTAAWKMEF